MPRDPSHRPWNPAGGWQATPGQPIPRAARQPAANGLLLVMLLLVWFSPAVHRGLAAGAGGDPAPAPLALVALHPRRPRLRSALVLAVTGPEEALRRHIFVPQHFWQYVALHFGFGPPGTRITVGQFLWDLVATQVWLAVPVGLLAASLSVWNAERAAGGAEWSPFVRRRQRIDQRTRDRKTARLVARPRDHKLTAPALGIALDGDLRQLAPRPLRRPAGPAAGQGHGRGRRPRAPARPSPCCASPTWPGVLGRKVCFVDCKGTDPTLVPALIAAYRLGNPSARVGCWPDTAMDMWRGTPVQVASRLLAVEQFTEPFYQRVASAGLRLALTAPDMPPVDGSDELLRRLDVDELAALWEGRPLQLKDIEAIGDHLPGARLRYADFFAALAGAFDRGPLVATRTSTWPSSPSPPCCRKSEADAAMRVVLEDYGHYATGRKPREGEDALLVLDEFSALASGVDSAINLAERVRDVGVQVVVAAQSVEGLGDHRQAPRLLASCAGGIVVHQCPDPERLLALAGMVRILEHNWELDHYGPRGLRQGPHGGPAPDRPRAGPPGPARRSLGHPGRPVHPPARPATARRGAGAGRAGGHPSAGRRHHAAADGRGAGARSGSRPPSPWPAGSCAGPASGSAGGGSAPGGCPPRPAAVAGRAAPARTGAAMRSPAGTGLACGAARGNPAPATRTGRLPAGRAATWPPPASRALARSSRPCGTGLRPPLTRPSSRRPGETRSPGAGEEQRPTSRQEAGMRYACRTGYHSDAQAAGAPAAATPSCGRWTRRRTTSPHGRRGSRGPGAGPPGGDAPRHLDRRPADYA